jgi:hypothetical protein
MRIQAIASYFTGLFSGGGSVGKSREGEWCGEELVLVWYLHIISKAFVVPQKHTRHGKLCSTDAARETDLSFGFAFPEKSEADVVAKSTVWYVYVP